MRCDRFLRCSRVLYDGPDHGNNGPMGSGCDVSDRDVRKVEGTMGIALEGAGSLWTCSHEVRKTREYLPSDGPLPTPGDMHAKKVLSRPKISQVKVLLEFCFEVIEVDTTV
jgi:hypothetical protein